MNHNVLGTQHLWPSLDKLEETSNPSAIQEWITVDEAVIYFRSLGLPRSPEAIRGYCRAGKLDSTTTEGLKGEQHVIRRESARIFIEDRKRILAAMSRNDAGDDGMTRKLPVTSVRSRDIPEDDGRARNGERATDAASTEAAKDAEIARLRDEVMSLKIDKAARDQIVSMLREERSKISEEAMSANRKVGELEARLQLGAPADHGVIRIHRSDAQQDGGIDADRVY